jgi:hypothetical protein
MEPSTQIPINKSPKVYLDPERVKRGYRRAKKPTMELLATFANLPDSEEIMNAVQEGLLRPTNPGALQRFCKELRTLWEDLASANAAGKTRVSERSQNILRKWCEAHPLNDPAYWNVCWATSTFFPTELNWRPLFARVLFDNRQLAGICKGCGKFFRKRRIDSNYCKSEACDRFNHLQRQKKYLAKHGRKRTA